MNVTQFGTAAIGVRPGTLISGSDTWPITLRSGSEYATTALARMLVTHSTLLSGCTPMPCDGDVSRWWMTSMPGAVGQLDLADHLARGEVDDARSR